MPGFEVHSPAVNEAGTRLGGISDSVLAGHAAVAATSGAADGTPVAGAYEDLLGHFAAVLPHFALSGASLSAAVGGAGENYQTTDQTLGASFTKGEPEDG